MSAFRWPALLLIPALIVGAIVYDTQSRPGPSAADPAAAPGIPTLGPGDAISSVWYCPAASLRDDDQIEVRNLGDEDRVGAVTFFSAPIEYGDELAGFTETEVSVPAGEVATIVAGDDRPGPGAVAAMVEFDGGGVVVEHLASITDLGATDRRPCATEASDVWFFPAGATVSDPEVSAATEQLVLLNPFPDPAVVDITFDTSNGPRQPGAYEAIVVSGRSARLLEVNDEVANVEQASATVRARSGRIIVDRVLSYDGTVARQGLSVSSGSTRAALELWLPEGRVSDGYLSSIFITNPGAEPAEIDLEILSPEVSIIEPFERSVPAGETIEIVIGSDASAEAIGSTGPVRVLEGVRTFSAIIRSVNDVPVVAERRDLVLRGSVAVPGLSTTMASPVAVTRWSVDVTTLDPEASSIVIQNPNFDTIATVVVRADGGDPLDFELPRGGRVTVPVSELGGSTIVVEAATPVVVERVIVGLTSRSTALAVPAVG